MKIGLHLWASYHGNRVTACRGAAHGLPAVSHYVTRGYAKCKIMGHCFIACSYLYSCVNGQRYSPALKQYVVRVTTTCAAADYSNTAIPCVIGAFTDYSQIGYTDFVEKMLR